MRDREERDCNTETEANPIKELEKEDEKMILTKRGMNLTQKPREKEDKDRKNMPGRWKRTLGREKREKT